MVALFKGAVLKRAFEAAPGGPGQCRCAKGFKQAPIDAKISDEELKALNDGLGNELAALAKLLVWRAA